jgi:hypothetical protein
MGKEPYVWLRRYGPEEAFFEKDVQNARRGTGEVERFLFGEDESTQNDIMHSLTSTVAALRTYLG